MNGAAALGAGATPDAGLRRGVAQGAEIADDTSMPESTLPPGRDELNALAHTLRSPLNTIIGFTGTLLMELPGPLNDAQKAQLELVQRAAEDLLVSVDGMLARARSEEGA